MLATTILIRERVCNGCIMQLSPDNAKPASQATAAVLMDECPTVHGMSMIGLQSKCLFGYTKLAGRSKCETLSADFVPSP